MACSSQAKLCSGYHLANSKTKCKTQNICSFKKCCSPSYAEKHSIYLDFGYNEKWRKVKIRSIKQSVVSTLPFPPSEMLPYMQWKLIIKFYKLLVYLYTNDIYLNSMSLPCKKKQEQNQTKPKQPKTKKTSKTKQTKHNCLNLFFWKEYVHIHTAQKRCTHTQTDIYMHI